MEEKTLDQKQYYYKKYGINYRSLSKKSKEYLDQAYEYVIKTCESFNNLISEALAVEVSVTNYVDNTGISRATIYKKDKNGDSQYKDVINYLNKCSAELQGNKRQRLQFYIKEKNIDQQLLDNLLKKDIEYENQKAHIMELESRIRELEKQLKQKYLV